MKSTAPGSILYHICLRDLFLFPFVCRSIIPKTQKYLAAIFCYLFYFAFPRDLFIQSTTNQSIFYPGGIDNPSYASGCKYLFFLCRYHLHSILGSSTGLIPWVSQPRGILTVDVLHHPFLFGEIPTQSLATSKEFLAPL